MATEKRASADPSAAPDRKAPLAETHSAMAYFFGHQADEWLRDMEAAVVDLDPNDADLIDAAIRQMDGLAKEQVRREMGQP